MAEREDLRQSDGGAMPARRKYLASLAVKMLLVFSVVMNVLLGNKISHLNEVVLTLKSEGRLSIGAKVPAIAARSVDGTQQTLTYNDVQIPTVLYVFTPQCKWCKKNIDNLRVLINNSGPRYRLVGVSLTRQNLREYLEQEHLRLPVYTDIEDSTKSVYRFGGTPTTIVVSPEATVLRVWSGAYQHNIRQEIEHYLNLRLPGCCDERAADEQSAYTEAATRQLGSTSSRQGSK